MKVQSEAIHKQGKRENSIMSDREETERRGGREEEEAGKSKIQRERKIKYLYFKMKDIPIVIFLFDNFIVLDLACKA